MKAGGAPAPSPLRVNRSLQAATFRAARVKGVGARAALWRTKARAQAEDRERQAPIMGRASERLTAPAPRYASKAKRLPSQLGSQGDACRVTHGPDRSSCAVQMLAILQGSTPAPAVRGRVACICGFALGSLQRGPVDRWPRGRSTGCVSLAARRARFCASAWRLRPARAPLHRANTACPQCKGSGRVRMHHGLRDKLCLRFGARGWVRSMPRCATGTETALFCPTGKVAARDAKLAWLSLRSAFLA